MNMKIIKDNHPYNSVRIIEKFAFSPKRIYEYDKLGNLVYTWVFNKPYYECQQWSITTSSWYVEEQSSWNPKICDFKWDKKYIDLWE